MEWKKVSFLAEKGFLLQFQVEEEREALAFVLKELERAQKGLRARRVEAEEVERVWPALLKGREVALTGGEVARRYAERWRATTTLFQAVSRRRRGEVRLFFRVSRPQLNGMGDLSRHHFLPFSGLYAWLALNQEARMRDVLGRRATRLLGEAVGEGTLLVRRLPGGAALLLRRKEEGWGLELALPGSGLPPFPLEGWDFRRAAERWALDPQNPPSLESLVRWLGEHGLRPKGMGTQRLAKGGWAAILQELVMREIAGR